MFKRWITRTVAVVIVLIGSVQSQAINDACVDVSACTGITNVECRDDGGGLQCLCQTGYSPTSATTCDIIINGACTVLADCGAITGNVECRDDGGGLQCLCQTGYTASDATTCTIVDCGSLTNPTDGSIALTSGTTYNSQAFFSCDTGFQLTGTSPRTCQADGFWSGAEDQVCQAIVLGSTCTAASDCTAAGITNVECRNDGSGDQCLCETGYSASDATTCDVVDCGGLTDLTDGSIVYTLGTKYNSVAFFSCDAGFQLTSSTSRQCQANGLWSGAEDQVCQAIVIGSTCTAASDCTDAGITNVECRDDGSGDQCLCATGYSASDATTCDAIVINGACTALADCGGITGDVECRDDGGGNKCLCQTGYAASDATTCSIVDCGGLTDPTDGSIAFTSGTTYSSFAFFSCDAGFQLTGSTSRQCQSNGLWSGAEDQVCQAIVIGSTCTAASDCTAAGITNVECRDDGSGLQCLCQTGYTASDATTCDAVDCGDPGIAQSSLSPGDTTYNLQIFVTCNTGYTAGTGNGLITCLATGLWDPIRTCEPVDCGSLAAPANGAVDASATTYLSVATFSCDTGYTLQGSATLTCQAGTSWDNALPTCQINDCGNLENPLNGVADDSAGTTFNSVATFTCNTGYTMIGSGNSICQANQQWDNTDPNCQINDCGNLLDPPNGVADDSGGTTYLSVATFTCDTGYTLEGTATSTCQANEQWDNTDPQCTINDCGIIGPPANGDVTFPSGTTYGESADYTCGPGYDLNGVTSRTCQPNGSWSDTDPTCDIKDCGTLTAPANGDVTYSNNGATTYLETATFTCDLGYDLTGTTTRTCEAGGNWGGASPTCVIKDCLTLASPTHGAVDVSSGTTFGETATYSCDTGYSMIGDQLRQCKADGTWAGVEPACQIMDCSTLTAPTNGQVSVGTTTYNSVANYSCNTGYDIHGVSSRTCQPSGLWSGEQPTCELKACPTPPYLLNGDFTTPTGTLYGATAVYTCTTGFGLVGSATVQCLDTGEWDTLPICSKDCGTPSSIENGVYSEPTSTLVDAEVTYSCNSGYTLVGKAIITCQSDTGTWTSAPGCQLMPVAMGESCHIDSQCVSDRATCKSDGLGDTTCQCAATGEIYDSTTDACLADCRLLTNPTNGIVTLPQVTSEGQTAIYSCNVGFALNDVSKEVRTCLSTGLWSLSAPLCVIGCPDPMPPVHGSVDVSAGRAAGDTVTYSCDEGYRLIGELTRECRDDTVWSGNDPMCHIECPILSAIEDGKVDLSGGYWEGSIATYICDKDYALVGTSTRTCQSTGKWNGVVPTCIFAIFPAALLAVIGLLIFIVIVDILIVGFCIYLRYNKKKKKNKRRQEQDFDDIGEQQDEEKYPISDYDDEKPLEKMENGIPPTTLITSGPLRASIKKQRNSKVAPEDANKKTAQVPPKKPPVPKLDKSAAGNNKGGVPKPKPLPKGAYKNTKPFGPKVYGPEPIRFKNESIPFVPLETSEPPPSTLQQQIADELKDEKIADVDKLLKEGGYTSETSDRKNPKKPTEEDLISIDHLTNPVFNMDDKGVMMDYDAHNRKPITKLEDTQDAFKGRIQLPRGPEKSGVTESEGEQRQMSEEAKKHMKTSMSAYSPTLGGHPVPKWNY